MKFIVDFRVQLNGTGWAVQGGRRDGLVAFSVAAAEEDIPSPDLDVTQLIANFAVKGLSARQMVVLSGPSIESGRECSFFHKE